MKRLICILIALNLLILIALGVIHNSDEKNSEGAVYITRVETEKVKKIEVSLTDESYAFEFNDAWLLTGDGKVTLNQKAVGELADDVAVISALEVIETNPDKVKKYGISSMKIKVTYNDGKEALYALGNKVLNSNRYYFYSYNDNSVYAITAQKKEALFKRLADYRKITAIKCDADNISTIKIGDITIENRNDRYVVTSPHAAIASAEKIHEFLHKYFGEISGKKITEQLIGVSYTEYMDISITDIYGVTDSFKLYFYDGKYYLYIDTEEVAVEVSESIAKVNIWSFVSNKVFDRGTDAEEVIIMADGREYSLSTEETADLCRMTAVDFGERKSDKELAVITIKFPQNRDYVYRVYEYNSRYVSVYDGFGTFLVAAEGMHNILKK